MLTRTVLPLLTATLVVGCAHPRPPTAATSIPSDTLWISANGVPNTDAGPGLWLAARGAPTAQSVCTSASRGGPLWQQLDLSTVRVVCLADANNLRRPERLEQRYQAPAAVAPSGVEHLIVAIPSREGAGAVVLQDLMDASDPMALRMVVQRGETSTAELPGGAWGLLELTVGPGRGFSVTRSGDTLRVESSQGEPLVFTPSTGWTEVSVASE